MVSRLPTYLHPLAGRNLAWHLLSALAAFERPPSQLFFVVAGHIADPSVVAGLPAEVVEAGPSRDWWSAVRGRLREDVEHLLIVDATAVAMAPSLAALLGGATERVLRDGDGEPLALWLTRGFVERAARPSSTHDLAAGCDDADPADPAELFAVRDRQSLARASRIIRDRLVKRLMASGVTVLLPETVLVDVDVVVGPDSVIYPGVVLEGNTSVGAETVIGPGCRIIDTRIGTGVELKGWNYLVGTTIRNRAVLEPYVRRGFD